MSPPWYEDAAEGAAENHDPAEYDGREWDELTDDERHQAVIDYLY